MRFVAALALLLAVATTTVAARETNAKRLARGLPPLPPARRASNTDSANRHKPSPAPYGDDNGDDGGDNHDNQGDDSGGGDSYGWTAVKRLARGLLPVPPVRRASGTESAKKHKPSKALHGGGDDGGDNGDDGNYARGLLPVPPARRASDTDSAKKHKPSKALHGGGDDGGDNGDDGNYARGLLPMPPARRASGTDSAKKHKPSKAYHGDGEDGGDDYSELDDRGSTPVRRALDIENYCRGVPAQCCSSITMIANPVTGVVASLVGATLPAADVPIGLGCSPIIGEDDWCYGHTVCCGDDSYDGIIAMDCTPV